MFFIGLCLLITQKFIIYSIIGVTIYYVMTKNLRARVIIGKRGDIFMTMAMNVLLFINMYCVNKELHSIVRIVALGALSYLVYENNHRCYGTLKTVTSEEVTRHMWS